MGKAVAITDILDNAHDYAEMLDDAIEELTCSDCNGDKCPIYPNCRVTVLTKLKNSLCELDY